jgi:hypothetical protein
MILGIRGDHFPPELAGAIDLKKEMESHLHLSVMHERVSVLVYSPYPIASSHKNKRSA